MPDLRFTNMRPHDFVIKKLRPSNIVQPKIDGIRVHYYKGQFYFVRSGDMVRGLRAHRDEIESMPLGYDHIDCEAVVPGFDFDTASGIIRAHKHPLKSKIILNIFDLPCIEGDLIERMSHMNAIKHLGKLKMWDVVPTFPVHSTAEVKMWFGIWRNKGYEGMMIKNPWGRYVDCGTTRRSWDWMRWKPELTVDAILIGMEEGRGKFKGSVGVLIFDREGDRIRAGRGKLTDKQADHIYNNFEKYRGRCGEIVYQRRSSSGGYRHPRFRRWRNV